MLQSLRGMRVWGMVAFVLVIAVGAMASDRPTTNKEALLDLSKSFKERLEAQRTQVYRDMLSSTDPAQVALNEDPDIQLMYINEHGLPRYYTIDNYDAAESMSTDELWPGGSSGYNLTGAGTALGRMGIWDGGAVRTTHQEFGGRVTQDDSPGGTSYHATHVAGTMMGGGVQQACADLRPSDFTLSGGYTVAAGENLDTRLAAEIQNVGNVAASSSNVGFFISTNSYISEMDQLLIGGRESVPALDPGESFVVTMYGDMQIPVDWPAGTAWIGVLADELFAISECQEYNNNIPIEVMVTAAASNQANFARYDAGEAEASMIAEANAAAEAEVSLGMNTRGMSYEGTLLAYDWDNDLSEMSFAAAAYDLNVSNHSYSYIHGWSYRSSEEVWYWYGDHSLDPNEEYGFGYYGDAARDWDQLAYDAPYYTICKSAGNDRDDMGPAPGEGHYYYDGGWIWTTVIERPPDCPTGYDCVGIKGSAKNLVTVAAVWDIPHGYNNPADVVMSHFSGWGPTDDGRIKPDISANGMNLLSAFDGHDAEYGSISGTSMSTPAVAGSLNLLVRYYESLNGGQTPLSATVKAVMIHGADEAGPDPGPDYMFGWGMMNTLTSARTIDEDTDQPERIIEDQLAITVDESDRFLVKYDGVGPLRLTMAWTDLPGDVAPYSVDPPDLILVNDLDMRLEHANTGTLYYPWVLDPAFPSAAATTGDNFRDNVEQIHVDAPDTGWYIVTIEYKSELASAWQEYSLISTHQIAHPCCGFYDGANLTGNVNFDPDGVRDLQDILDLASYAFLSGPRPLCLPEGNVDGDENCVYELTDVLNLASYAYLGGALPAACLPECEQ